MCEVLQSSRLLFTIPSPQEVLRISKCTNAFYRYAFPPLDTSAQLLTEMDEQTRFEFNAQLLTGEWIGYIKGYCPVAGDHLWIQTLIIEQNYSRQGFGTEILLSVVQTLSQKHELKQIYLTCHQLNQIGNSFWKKLGFQVIEYNIKKAYFLYNTSIRSLLCTRNHFSL